MLPRKIIRQTLIDSEVPREGPLRSGSAFVAFPSVVPCAVFDLLLVFEIVQFGIHLFKFCLQAPIICPGMSLALTNHIVGAATLAPSAAKESF